GTLSGSWFGRRVLMPEPTYSWPTASNGGTCWCEASLRETPAVVALATAKSVFPVQRPIGLLLSRTVPVGSKPLSTTKSSHWITSPAANVYSVTSPAGAWARVSPPGKGTDGKTLTVVLSSRA